MTPLKITFFKSPSDLRRWFAKHHLTSQELWAGYYKKSSANRVLPGPNPLTKHFVSAGLMESEKALMTLVTPSALLLVAVNIKRAQELVEQGLMQPEGLKAFQARTENRSGIYSYEQRNPELPAPYKRLLRENPAAWQFFQAKPVSYRKAATWFVLSAKKEVTRLKRLQQLIEDSAQGRTIPQFTRTKERN